MINLKKVLTDYADSKKYKLKEMDNGIFSLDISMKLSDGSMRYQYVWIWVIPGRAKGQDCIYLNSRVGTFNPTINLYGLMKDSGAGGLIHPLQLLTIKISKAIHANQLLFTLALFKIWSQKKSFCTFYGK